ncbi:S8 family serine peptidase [Xanthomonas campestris pv. raphani]|uniref:S8 family serine peptidase n=1 Tax=Xanthomonas campestris TaxID=339 RepID=UPI002B22BB98|nr:S8 family serine peptidase [Xanthomonas campestris]MEA9859113.1 S8 family serine peptidase [Xanthomonas campestris pv. raphani]MEA9940407.1 S8 family serine peptidase [Xanthomonas campestris pv. raphani]
MQSVESGDFWVSDEKSEPMDAWAARPEDRQFVGLRPQKFIVVPPGGCPLDESLGVIASVRHISFANCLSGDNDASILIPPEFEEDPPVEVLKHIGVVLTDLSPEQASDLESRGYAVFENELCHVPPPISLEDVVGLGDFDPFYAGMSGSTWGIEAIGAHLCQYSGRGVKVAVLDTGCDPSHPDFSERIQRSNVMSFVTGENAIDKHGHGTHVCGIVAGPRHSASGVRYGVAPDCELLVVKVLANSGSGYDSWILKGMNWAADRGADVINMSLGAPRKAGSPASAKYEALARFFLENDIRSLVVAAAGNASSRPVTVAPVGNPAACDSIMSIAAVGKEMTVASFSCGKVDQGVINLSAPGVGILSSYRQGKFLSLNGTSMAAPHVAGVAALWAESDPALRGGDLWEKLIDSAVALTAGGEADVGAGLVQAP